MANWGETGKDTQVSVNGSRIATTTTSYSIEYENSVSDMDDSPTPNTATVSRWMEGSMEWDGSQAEVHRRLIRAEGDQTDSITLRIRGTEYTYRCTDVTIESLSKDEDATSHTSGTLEWRADNFRRE